MKTTRRNGRRHGQIQFGESIMVVIILVFILVIGIVFYFKVSEGAIQSELRHNEDVGAVTLARHVVTLPEVRCGQLTGTEACIDMLKLKALSGMLTYDDSNFDQLAWDYYSELFEYATIKVHVLDGTEMTLYDDKPEEQLEEANQFIFTTIYDPVSEQQKLGYFNVTRYTKGGSTT